MQAEIEGLQSRMADKQVIDCIHFHQPILLQWLNRQCAGLHGHSL